MTVPAASPDATGRQRYLVRVIKRADAAARRVFRQLFPDQATLDEHGWMDAFGALDDDSASEPGEAAWFSVELNQDQVAAFAGDPDVSAIELQPPNLAPPRPVEPAQHSDDAPADGDTNAPGPSEATSRTGRDGL